MAANSQKKVNSSIVSRSFYGLASLTHDNKPQHHPALRHISQNYSAGQGLAMPYSHSSKSVSIAAIGWIVPDGYDAG